MALLSPALPVPAVASRPPALRFSSPLRPGLPLWGCFSTPRKLGSGRPRKGALGAGAIRAPLRLSGGSLDGRSWTLALEPFSGEWTLTRRRLFTQQVFIECLLCAAAGYGKEQNRYSCPRGASGPAPRRTHTGTAHRDTQTQTDPQTHHLTLRETRTPARPTGAVRDPRLRKCSPTTVTLDL